MRMTFRPSQQVKMVWRVAGMSATSRACHAHGIWKQAALRVRKDATRMLWNLGLMGICHYSIAYDTSPT